MTSPRDVSPFVPFDLYDFFGYLFPGILFAINVTFFYSQLNPSLRDIFIPNSTTPTDIPFVSGLAIVVGSIVALYTLGHIIATLSHTIIDRVLIDGIEGYPINYLLEIPKPSRPFSENTFKYIFILYNLLLIEPVLISNYSVFINVLIATLKCIALLILPRIIIMFIRWYPKGQKQLQKIRKWKLLQSFLRLFLLPSTLLIDPLIDFLRRLLGLDRKFPDAFIALYKNLFAKRFGKLNPNDVGTENYWLSAFSANINHEIHDRTLRTWLHLYGFARNATAAFYVSSSLIIGHMLFNPAAFTLSTRIQLGVLWFLAAFMGTRYWILYSNYYTKGVIRAFVEVETRQTK